ncbi:AprI/Inh family metalloprotease inhibitor [Pseudomonas sp. Irchel s3a18]|uniref:AprI/Inh family metalloprotease inhibitor n=1 Tax=Pseudomonas sp. Irchel s3a18 TaxID=2009053 RepID=UPI000BA4B669|nr:AprI/Inh family metalloprotease inhibitor [Pseudomonas sp. Irchel s3a18]
MTINAFTYKAMAWLIATLIMFSGDVGMASSLRLADPSELAGTWQVHLRQQPQNTCALKLEPDQTLGGDVQCLAGWLGQLPVGWFTEPDGISLTNKDGSRIIHLGRQQNGRYQSNKQSDPAIVLQRD